MGEPLTSLGGMMPRSILSSRWTYPRMGLLMQFLSSPLEVWCSSPRSSCCPFCSRQLPYPQTIEWDIPLTSFKFKAREWKYPIEGYKGPDWFITLWNRVTPIPPGRNRPLTLNILSRRMESGGYAPEEFLAMPLGGS